jgi:hypothetical protein
MTKAEKEKKLKWLKKYSPYNWNDSDVEDEIFCSGCTNWFKLYEYKKRAFLAIGNDDLLGKQEVCPHCLKTGPDDWVNKDVYNWLIEQPEE